MIWLLIIAAVIGILLVIALLALPIIGFVIGCKKHKRGLAKAGAIVLAIYSWFIGFGVIGSLSVLFKFLRSWNCLLTLWVCSTLGSIQSCNGFVR